MNETQRVKAKFRSSSIWKKWRKFIYHKDKGIDYITGKKLYSGYNCHHLDLNEAHYKDLTDPSHFISLNKQTHQFIHWAYLYYRQDKAFVDRFKEILDRMVEINDR